jgi:phthiodiolone/phenolphthiodiolone dimycocerosates ketoreductase
VAAHGPRMLRLTGLYGDGWYPTLPMSPEEYREALVSVRTVASDQGRDGAGITAAMQTFYLAAPDRSTAERWLGHRAIRFLALLAPDAIWQKAGVRHPLGSGFRGMVDFIPSHHHPKAIDAAIDAVPVDVLADFLLWGTPDDVIGRLRALGGAGLEHVSLAPLAPLVSRRALLFTLRTLPQIVRRLRDEQ